MRAKELERFKKLLLSQKAELLNNTRKLLKEEAQHSSDDLADETDLASSEINQSLTLRLRDRERLLIQKVEAALSKIQNGSYGTCEECEEPIEAKTTRSKTCRNALYRLQRRARTQRKGFRLLEVRLVIAENFRKYAGP